jgi:hypothetical protein
MRCQMGILRHFHFPFAIAGIAILPQWQMKNVIWQMENEALCFCRL